MTIVAVDDEKMALEALPNAIREADPEAELHSVRWSEDALGFAEKFHIDVAFLDVAMPDANGVQLARRLTLSQPQMHIIFATGFGQYRAPAFDLHASGYLMKPITAEKVWVELDHLRYPVHPKSGWLPISQHRGRLGIVPEQIECDYFDYLSGKGAGKTAYRGEYMTQYSWGEYTNGLLEMQAVKN